MSDHAPEVRRRTPTRVRSLGDAVPTFRPFRDDTDEPKIVPKTSDELRADAEERRDSQPMTASCAIDGCGWTHTATAGECRDAAAGHRATSHPSLKQGHRRSGYRFKRPGEHVDPATVAESRRLRQERDDAARLATIEAGRAARGELLEEVESARDVGSASSSGPLDTRQEGNTMTTCKIDGCANDAPARGRYARLCISHRQSGLTGSTSAAPPRSAAARARGSMRV